MDPKERELSSIALAINVALDALMALVAVRLYTSSRLGLHGLWWFVPTLLVFRQVAVAWFSAWIFSRAVLVLSWWHQFLPDDLVVIRPILARQGPIRVVKVCKLSPWDCWYPWPLLAYAHVPRVHLLASCWNPCSRTSACVPECTPKLCRVHSGTPVEVMLEQGRPLDLVASFRVAISAEFALAAFSKGGFADFMQPTNGSSLVSTNPFSECLNAELTRIVHEATDQLLREADCGHNRLTHAIVKACREAKLSVWDVKIRFGN